MTTDGPGRVALARADVRDARVLAATEIRAQIRRIVGDLRKLLGLAVMGLVFGLGMPLVALGSAVSLGRRLAGGDPAVGAVGAVLTAVLGGGLYLGGAGAVQQTRVGSIGPLVRTSIPPTAVVLGRLASETVQAMAVGVPGALLLLFGVAYGAGGPLAPLVLLAATVPPLVVGVLAGRAVGIGLRYGSQRLGLSLWLKAVAYVTVFVVVMVGVQTLVPSVMTESGDSLGLSIPALFPGLPVQAYASVLLVPFGAAVRPLGAVLLAAAVAGAPLGLWATVRVERALLLAEAGGDDRGDDARSRAVPPGFDLTQSGRVAWRYLIRTVRDPRMLSHLLPVLFGVLGMAGTFVLEPGLLLDFGSAGATLFGGVLAGAAYCLNPMGDDRDQLPLVLTSAPSTATMLRGRMLAGTALGTAVAAGLGVPLAVLDGSPQQLVAPLVFGPLFMLAAAGTALGFGALVPKFERREYVNVERSHPSMLALWVYGFGGFVAGVLGLVLVAFTVGGGFSVWVLGGWVLYTPVVGGIGLVGYVYAVRKFDGLSLDDV